MPNLQLCLANVNELQKLSMKCEIQSTQCCVNQINNVRYLIRRESCIYIALQYCSFFSFDFEEWFVQQVRMRLSGLFLLRTI